jgi:hypothetical protein
LLRRTPNLQKLLMKDSKESLGAGGYEPTGNWNFNNLQDAGGPRKAL